MTRPRAGRHTAAPPPPTAAGLSHFQPQSAVGKASAEADPTAARTRGQTEPPRADIRS
jgi:hypothetical protein